MCGRFQLADDQDIEEIDNIIAEAQANLNSRMGSSIITDYDRGEGKSLPSILLFHKTS
jgi:hypothetical protein